MRSEPYSREILRLAASLPEPVTLSRTDAQVEVRSESCGSIIRLALNREDDRVTALSAIVSACAYGQASAALMLNHAAGRSASGIEQALIAIDDWLEGSDALVPDWPGIEVLAPARDRPGRHGAVLLPFRALARAMQATER
ncbi:iron-sulfur cluster assembly scaffold protein [Sphingomicrobium sp. XHP0239]|uniref:iron-sulfur cluster assembly scaffold protein n=1 Tax=Sphingomicrobium maritimum TaxID=3133972 RepID=UPI0031CC98FC